MFHYNVAQWPIADLLAPHDYAFYIRCIAEKQDTVIDAFVTISAEDLPYKWGDTIFDIGTVSGTYRFQQNSCTFTNIIDLHLTVERSCPGVLINDVCWAESNVDEPGTFAATPEAYGMLYQWNRKKGWSATEAVSGWDSSLPSGKCWEAANNPCPAGWRVPTDGEFNALLDNMNVTSMETSQNGVRGRKFTDNTTGNSIFLPKANYRSHSGTINNMGYYGWYWSNSPLSDSFAKALHIQEKTCNSLMMAKNYGLTIRCVIGDSPNCDNIVTDTSVVICAKDLPYTWCDTIFDIGTESGTYSFLYVSVVTGCDSIVNLHLTVQQPYKTHLYDTLCQGDSYDKYGFSLSDVQEDDIYTLPLLSQAGCDSTVMLHLKVWQVYDTTVYDTICKWDGYYQHGLNLASVTESITQTQTLQTVHGCDSTVTLHLYVSKTYLIPELQDICQGDTIDFRGRRLYATGVYDDTLRTVHGCDSIFRLTLTVHPAPDLSFSDAICHGSDYHGYGFDLTAVTADTIVSDTLQTRRGCDSIRTLSLTVHPVYNRIFHDTICEGDGYHGYGFHLPEGTAGGTFTETYPSVHGCDSTVTLHLYVSRTYFDAAFQSICQGDTIDFRGRRLYASGVYDDTLTTVHGCDSIFRLALTVHPAPDLSFSDAVCYGSDYHSYGFDLTAVTADTIVCDTLKTPWGCDSIRTLFLTVNPLYDIQLYDTICQGDVYSLNGFHVTAPGMHVLHLKSVHSCDSIVTLHLTVNPVYHHTVRDSVCPSERYDRHGFHLSDIRQSGIYRLPLQTVHECDSIITLELYVYHNYFYSLSQSICEGDTVDFRGRRLYEIGIYYDSLRTVHQCDSIYSLDLTVHPVYDIQLTGVLCEGSPYTGYGFNVTEPGTHVLRLKTIHNCDSIVTLTLTEEKKVQGGIGFLLDDCSTHGYSFFLDPPHRMDTWQWDMGDGTVYRSEEGFHQYADSGIYRIQLIAETHSGCENRFSHVQQVPYYLPEVAIHADRRVIDEDFPTVRFHTDVPRDMACEWDFGDGATARGDSVAHTFDATAREYYDVTLRVLNADSCVTENGTRIEVVFLPKSLNTFTPNGDGINDVFMAGYRIEVTDRNGLRIYAGDNGWDGTGKGGPAPQDTYFFRLYYRTANGERMKTGYVTLIR